MDTEQELSFNENLVFNTLEATQKTWNTIAVTNASFLIGLGSIAIIGTFFVIAFTGEPWFTPVYVKSVTFISSVILALLTGFGVAKKANNARNAWRHFQKEKLRYLVKQITILQLIDAYERCEVLMGDIEYRFDPKKDTKFMQQKATR